MSDWYTHELCQKLQAAEARVKYLEASQKDYLAEIARLQKKEPRPEPKAGTLGSLAHTLSIEIVKPTLERVTEPYAMQWREVAILEAGFTVSFPETRLAEYYAWLEREGVKW